MLLTQRGKPGLLSRPCFLMLLWLQLIADNIDVGTVSPADQAQQGVRADTSVALSVLAR